MATGALRVERETKSLREMALDRLRQAIIQRHFKPGDRLVERDLCEQLAVSRSVVREVLRHLEAEGVIEVVPNRGPIVAVLTRAQARQIYELRSYLEAIAAKGCAEAPNANEIANDLDATLVRITEAYAKEDASTILDLTAQFYGRMFAGSGREIAGDIVAALHMRITHLRSLTIGAPNRAKDGPSEMRRIVAAIRAGDGRKAFDTSRAHVLEAERIALALIEK